MVDDLDRFLMGTLPFCTLTELPCEGAALPTARWPLPGTLSALLTAGL